MMSRLVDRCLILLTLDLLNMEKFYSTHRHYAPGANRAETIEGESVTVPGEAKTIAQLLSRAMQGLEAQEREAHYFDQADLDKIDRFYAPGLDLTDLDELTRRNDEMAVALEKAKKAKAEKDAKEAFDKAEAKKVEEANEMANRLAALSDAKSKKNG